MSPRAAGLLIAVAAVLLVGALVLAPWRPEPAAEEPPAPAGAESAEPAVAPIAAAALEQRPVTLYLPSDGGTIAPLAALVESAPEPKARVEALLGALIAARPKPPLSPLFADAEVRLAGTMRGVDGTLYVDLAGADAAALPPASGSQLELQRVYAIVQTVVENEPAYERVALLWAGVQRPTFAGHVDTGRALVPWPALVARAAGREPDPPGTP